MRVIAIPKNDTLLISYNEFDKIKKGAFISIYIPGPKVIIDKEGNDYGTYDFIKEIVEITKIFPHFVECKKFSRYFDKLNYAISPLNSLGKTPINLNVNEEDIDSSIIPSSNDTTIRVGDLARII